MGSSIMFMQIQSPATAGQLGESWPRNQPRNGAPGRTVMGNYVKRYSEHMVGRQRHMEGNGLWVY
jgi:hypothetical protein